MCQFISCICFNSSDMNYTLAYNGLNNIMCQCIFICSIIDFMYALHINYILTYDSVTDPMR